jgi:hypothetical protein
MRKDQPSCVPGHVDIALCQRTFIIHRRLHSEAVSLSRKNTWTHVTVIFVLAPWPLSFPSAFVARLRYRFSSRPLAVCLQEFHPINIHASSSKVHHPAWRLSCLALHTDGFRVRDHWNPHIFTRIFPFFSLEVKSLYRFLLHEGGNYLLNHESNQQYATIQVNLLFLVSSTCFGRCFRPSPGTLDCICSIW